MKEKFYEQMFLIRKFEEKVEELFTKGDLFGTTHGCIGQEAVAVGIANAINKDDIITSNHRGHGHFIAFTDDVEGLLAELMGKANGVCAGRSGSQHLCKGNFYSNGLTGGMTAVATGMAFAEKMKKSNKVVVAFFGDGALGEGVLYESFNIASLWKLPIIYVLENNYYAMSTHISCGVAGSMSGRGKAFGIETIEINSNDVDEIYLAFNQAVQKIRKESGPFLFIVHTYRLCGHSKSDDRLYRSREEEQSWRDKDPLLILRERMEKKLVEQIENKCLDRINKAIIQASNEKYPRSEEIDKGLFQ